MDIIRLVIWYILRVITVLILLPLTLIKGIVDLIYNFIEDKVLDWEDDLCDM